MNSDRCVYTACWTLRERIFCGLRSLHLGICMSKISSFRSTSICIFSQYFTVSCLACGGSRTRMDGLWPERVRKTTLNCNQANILPTGEFKDQKPTHQNIQKSAHKNDWRGAEHHAVWFYTLLNISILTATGQAKARNVQGKYHTCVHVILGSTRMTH